MTKILYWNIENFAINKIQNPRPRKRKKGASISEAAASAQRFTYISRHITEIDPDIFIIVEVETPYNANRGVLCGGDGKTGLMDFCDYLQTRNPNWWLVPALIAGNKESVGVFYRGDRVQFTGPDYWSGGNGPTGPNVTALTAGAYPVDWSSRNAPGNLRAARVQFPVPGPLVGNVDFGNGVRHPYQTTFLDLAQARTLNIFTVHSPANYAGATTFLNDMITTPAIAGALSPNEVRIVLGDFNLALLRIADDTYTNCYAPLTGLANINYHVALEPAGGPPMVPLGYRGYFATHMRPKNNARCWSKIGEDAYYPTYAYSGDGNGIANESIDNVIWAGAVGDLAVNPPQLTVVNGLVASPYNNAGANPGGAPQGFANFQQEINWDWAGLNAQWIPPNYEAPDVAPQFAAAPGVRGWFLGWNVYGKIRSTSDHLPLLFNC